MDITLEELLEAGSHFGHQKRRWNPAMKGYIYGERDGVHIFDLAKTREGLLKACEYVENTVRSGGKVLFVGTKRQAADFVKSEAIRAGMPYITVRWMGGMFTNTSNLSKRIKKMVDMKAKREAGDYKKYTKKERLLIDREIEKLEKFFGGVVDLTGLPEAIFVIDTHKEDVAVREAVRTKVKVVGIVDTNANPGMVDYVIPANDDAVKSIELIVKAVADAALAGKTVSVSTEKDKPAKKEKKTKEESEEVATVAAEIVEEIEKKVEKKVEDVVAKEVLTETLAKAKKVAGKKAK